MDYSHESFSLSYKLRTLCYGLQCTSMHESYTVVGESWESWYFLYPLIIIEQKRFFSALHQHSTWYFTASVETSPPSKPCAIIHFSEFSTTNTARLHWYLPVWSTHTLSISLCQLSLCQFLTLSIPTLSTLTKWELTKLELTKWEVD